jgi:hypothetical protein
VIAFSVISRIISLITGNQLDYFPVKAAPLACMTGYARLVDQNEQGVFITIIIYGFDLLHIFAGLALAPQDLAGARVKTGPFFPDGNLQRFPVHIGNHQYVSAAGILHNGRDKPLFIKFQLWQPDRRLFHFSHL